MQKLSAITSVPQSGKFISIPNIVNISWLRLWSHYSKEFFRKIHGIANYLEWDLIEQHSRNHKKYISIFTIEITWVKKDGSFVFEDTIVSAREFDLFSVFSQYLMIFTIICSRRSLKIHRGFFIIVVSFLNLLYQFL